MHARGKKVRRQTDRPLIRTLSFRCLKTNTSAKLVIAFLLFCTFLLLIFSVSLFTYLGRFLFFLDFFNSTTILCIAICEENIMRTLRAGTYQGIHNEGEGPGVLTFTGLSTPPIEQGRALPHDVLNI